MAASGFVVLAHARNLAEVLTTAARAPGWLPGEQETLTSAAAALWAARTVLLADLDDPEARRRRAFGTPPIAVPADAMSATDAARALGLSRRTVCDRLQRARAAKVDGQYRVSSADLAMLAAD